MTSPNHLPPYSSAPLFSMAAPESKQKICNLARMSLALGIFTGVTNFFSSPLMLNLLPKGSGYEVIGTIFLSLSIMLVAGFLGLVSFIISLVVGINAIRKANLRKQYVEFLEHTQREALLSEATEKVYFEISAYTRGMLAASLFVSIGSNIVFRLMGS